MGPRERSTSNRDEAQKHRYVGDQYRVGGQSYGRVNDFFSFVFENEQVRFQVTVTIPGGKRYFFFVDFR